MTDASPRADERPDAPTQAVADARADDETQPVILAPEPTAEAAQVVPAVGSGRRGVRAWTWAVVVVAFALFALAGSVPTYGYVRNTANQVVRDDRDVDLREIWSVQADNLPDVGGDLLPTVVFWAAVLAFALGSAAVIWLSLAPNPAWAERAGTPPPPPAADGSPGGEAAANA